MCSVNIMVLILTLGGLIFVVAGYIQHRFPPKKVNHLYGYRTSTSMKSQESWNFAQQYSAKKMMKIGAYIINLGLLSWVTDLQLPWSVEIAITIMIVGPLIMLFKVESQLKKRFPKK